jgi:phosphoribosyl-AMP cyclohydrolase
MKINFSKDNGLVPVIIQGFKSKKVFMLGYMNKKSYAKTLKTGFVYFWSRSRGKLWLKGETSGNKLKVMNLKTDCDKDALLIGVKLMGDSVCHLGKKTCFSNKLNL